MSGLFKQTRAAFLLLIFWAGALGTLTGCPVIADETGGSRCDAERRCTAGAAEVCGEDGKTYACEAMATCEGVIIDPSGQACMLDQPTCMDPVCPPFECEGGVLFDENGCRTCSCAPVDCPDVDPTECGPGQVTVCNPDDVCGLDCWCEANPACVPVACNLFCANGYETDADGCEVCECNDEPPVCAYEACERGTRSECGPDRDGDGCPECVCVPLECPDEIDFAECAPGTSLECVEGPDGEPRWSCEPDNHCPEVSECDGPFEQLVCDDSIDGCCVCEQIECPPVLPPACEEGRVECMPDDVCGLDCWCEPDSCPVVVDVPDCDNGQLARGTGRDGCTFYYCQEVSCPDVACPEVVCPYGYEKDANGCQTCECAFPETCDDDIDCDLFCEYGRKQSADGCLLCECNPPPTCGQVMCNLACENGFEVDENGCEMCQCKSSECFDDTQCGFDEQCVFDLMEPVACCPPGALCDASIPACVGECQQANSCASDAQCAPNELCRESSRPECCATSDVACTDDQIACPFYCSTL